MDIKQNIVRIKTSTQMGSGIIYPCESSMIKDYKQSFIIFTNRHVVQDLFDARNIEKMVDFDMYDKNGKPVDMSQISQLELFAYGDIELSNHIEDIAAILIVFKYEIELDLEIKVLWEDTKLDCLYMEGFPKVLYNNEISSKMQLQGKYKNIFPKNNKIGVFQITDDYHWYSNFKDIKLFQGFSGGPVYSLENNSHFIVGLNQSILNIDDGENPFKLLYYYKFRYVLEYLRENGCIIFRRNKDNSVSVRWIYDNK